MYFCVLLTVTDFRVLIWCFVLGCLGELVLLLVVVALFGCCFLFGFLLLRWVFVVVNRIGLIFMVKLGLTDLGL